MLISLSHSISATFSNNVVGVDFFLNIYLSVDDIGKGLICERSHQNSLTLGVKILNQSQNKLGFTSSWHSFNQAHLIHIYTLFKGFGLVLVQIIPWNDLIEIVLWDALGNICFFNYDIFQPFGRFLHKFIGIASCKVVEAVFILFKFHINGAKGIIFWQKNTLVSIKF